MPKDKKTKKELRAVERKLDRITDKIERWLSTLFDPLSISILQAIFRGRDTAIDFAIHNNKIELVKHDYDYLGTVCHTTSGVFMDMLRGKLSPLDAWREGKLTITTNPEL